VHELLQGKSGSDLADINRALAPYGVAASVRLGFGNTYALAMAEANAQRRGIRTLSDLARHPDLALGLSQEFLNRKDGWPALKSAYGPAVRALAGSITVSPTKRWRPAASR
jgi:glycine betaine/choline ABC-type transport system substrate-binding protein